MYTPDIQDYVYICDNTFTKAQILDMEKAILEKLKFSLGRPYSLQFLRRYSKVADAKADHHSLGKYFLEIMLGEYELCHLSPSLQAAAACCLSFAVINEVSDPARVWSPMLVKHSGYRYPELRAIVIQLASYVKNIQSSRYKLIAQKYAKSKYLKISTSSKLSGHVINKLSDMANKLHSTC